MAEEVRKSTAVATGQKDSAGKKVSFACSIIYIFGQLTLFGIVTEQHNG